MLKWKIRVRRRRGVRKKGEEGVRKNRLAQRRERGEVTGERRGTVMQPCLFSESGDVNLVSV